MSKGITILEPDKKLLWKYYITSILVLIINVVAIASFLVPYLLSEKPIHWLAIVIAVSSVIVFIFIIALILLPFYYKSIKYELSNKDVVTFRGIVWKRVKTIPLRAVTNLGIIRGPIDRIFSIGTIYIHTAGYSSSKGPEEKLEGLVIYQEIYDQIMDKIQEYKSMTPVVSIEEEISDENFQSAILSELREIKELLKEK
ncbi:MAG: PH domain-containing protein [Asgard group archaeon]|nr:PH domain-containing protein [Asgard group archaeon]